MDNFTFQYNTSIPLFGFKSNETNVVILPNEPIFTVVSQSTLGIIGFFANLSVIITLSSTKKLRNKVINIYIINQVCIFSLIQILAKYAFPIKE